MCNNKNREFARLGEYDRNTYTDGKHEDVPIVKTKKHPEYSSRYSVYDIGVAYLEYDVTFNGIGNVTKNLPNLD